MCSKERESKLQEVPGYLPIVLSERQRSCLELKWAGLTSSSHGESPRGVQRVFFLISKTCVFRFPVHCDLFPIFNRLDLNNIIEAIRSPQRLRVLNFDLNLVIHAAFIYLLKRISGTHCLLFVTNLFLLRKKSLHYKN